MTKSLSLKANEIDFEAVNNERLKTKLPNLVKISKGFSLKYCDD